MKRERVKPTRRFINTDYEKLGKERHADFKAGYNKAVDKACRFLEKYMESLGYIDEWCRSGEDKFIKAMEEDV